MSEKTATRQAYGEALREYGKDEKVVVLEADLGECTNSLMFGKKYPDRFFEAGIAEANMIGMGAGFAACGKTAVVNTFAMFAAGRGYEQIRNSCAYPGLNVKIHGTNAGLTAAKDGATHEMIEDLALMRVIPGMTVLNPCDANETKAAVKAMLEYKGPVYIRTGRLAVENVTEEIPGYHFEIGKGITVKEGGDAAVIATGMMVQLSLKAAEILEQENIFVRVIDMHTVKPLDEEIICKAAADTGALVTVEDHNILGGLGGAVAEVVTANSPVPLERVGVEDVFGRSGDGEELMRHYGLTAEHIVEKVRKVIGRKKI